MPISLTNEKIKFANEMSSADAWADSWRCLQPQLASPILDGNDEALNPVKLAWAAFIDQNMQGPFYISDVPSSSGESTRLTILDPVDLARASAHFIPLGWQFVDGSREHNANTLEAMVNHRHAPKSEKLRELLDALAKEKNEFGGRITPSIVDKAARTLWPTAQPA